MKSSITIEPYVGLDDVRVVAINEHKEAAACLAEAFADDEAILYPFTAADMTQHTNEYKRKLHNEMMEYLTAAHIFNGLVTTVGPSYASVAIWLPPGRDIDNWLTIVRSGLWRMYFRLSRQGRQRFFDEFLPLLQDTKQEVLGERDDESYYLVYLGTKRKEQRKGQLIFRLEADLREQQADFENRVCYLESTGSKNTDMYTARGFVYKRTIHLNPYKAPIALDIMVREPKLSPATHLPLTSLCYEVKSMSPLDVPSASIVKTTAATVNEDDGQSNADEEGGLGQMGVSALAAA
ncbi:MAG: hypothetical protein M1838_000770 [Thelocarpon superellum]|nr:MAG: hypothetical protein M1838_000770 [Thelocarpon superellum]